MVSKKTKNKRRDERYPLEEEIEFSLEGDVLDATGVDVSQTGISLTTKFPFGIKMRLKIAGEIEQRRARIVWAVPLADGGVHVGMEFIDEKPPAEQKKEKPQKAQKAAKGAKR